MATSRNIEIAAEAITAGQFSRLGFDVSVQYGAHQPEYDLVVGKGNRLLKISVKGTQLNGWGLCQKYKTTDRTYHDMIDIWQQQLDPQLIFCLVDFHTVSFEQLPPMYLAKPYEIAERLKQARGGIGSSTLWIEKVWGQRAAGAGSIERVPESWRFSPERIAELLAE